MKPQSSRDYLNIRRLAWIYLGLLFGLAFTFGILHFFFSDLRVGRVWWFNLDKERNIPTWFSGVLLFLLGLVSLVAYYWEKSRNTIGRAYFRLPILWLGIAFTAFFMSLDEIINQSTSIVLFMNAEFPVLRLNTLNPPG